jgi:hypothetical protein
MLWSGTAKHAMPSARSHCPSCGQPAIVDLQDVLYSSRVDFFRCRTCLCWWMVPKGADEPATRIVLGNSESTNAHKIS